MTNKLNTAEVIGIASDHLVTLSGHIFDLLTVSKPVTPDAAVNLSKVVSKLSPLVWMPRGMQGHREPLGRVIECALVSGL